MTDIANSEARLGAATRPSGDRSASIHAARALFLGIIAVVPGIIEFIYRLLFPNEIVAGSANNPALVLTGSALIIVVGVVVDTLRQLEAQLVMRNYDRFIL
mgnify:CR=1 FL=1